MLKSDGSNAFDVKALQNLANYKDAYQCLICESGTQESRIGEPLTESEEVLLEDLIQFLEHIADVIVLLVESKRPTIKVVDILTSSVIETLKNVSGSNSPIFVMAISICTDILQSRLILVNQFPIIGLVFHIAKI